MYGETVDSIGHLSRYFPVLFPHGIADGSDRFSKTNYFRELLFPSRHLIFPFLKSRIMSVSFSDFSLW